MSTVGFGRLKRRASGYRSTSGTSGNFLKAILRSGGAPRENAESDAALRQALLLQLALKALDRVIAEYCGATRRRPSYAALAQYLEEREGGPEVVPVRDTGAKEEIPALLQPRASAA